MRVWAHKNVVGVVKLRKKTVGGRQMVPSHTAMICFKNSMKCQPEEINHIEMKLQEP